MAVCQRSMHCPNGPQTGCAGSSGSPRLHGPPLLFLRHVDSTPNDFIGLLRFNALPLMETLCTHPTRSSECTCPGRSSTGSAEANPPTSRKCLLKLSVLKRREGASIKICFSFVRFTKHLTLWDRYRPRSSSNLQVYSLRSSLHSRYTWKRLAT